MRKLQLIRAMREIGFTDYAIGRALAEIQDLRGKGKRIRYEDYLPDWHLKEKKLRK